MGDREAALRVARCGGFLPARLSRSLVDAGIVILMPDDIRRYLQHQTTAWPRSVPGLRGDRPIFSTGAGSTRSAGIVIRSGTAAATTRRTPISPV